MITIFNRAEVCITYNMDEQYRIRSILADHGIDYRVKTKNLTNPSVLGMGSRERHGSVGIKMDYAYEYIVYVHKKDYDLSMHLIHNSR